MEPAAELQVVDINVANFGSLNFSAHEVQQARHSFDAFMKNYDTPELCAEAFFLNVEQTASLKVLFTQARSVQALRFIAAFRELLNTLDKPSETRTKVEALGFQHLIVNVSVANISMFRDAFLELLEENLADSLQTSTRNLFASLFNYVGGALVFIRTNYADRLNLLTSSWKMAHEKNAAMAKGQKGAAADEPTDQLAEIDNKSDNSQDAANTFMGSQQMPTSFNEMFQINAAVMGYGTSANTWMVDVLDCFDNLVLNFSNNVRIREECDVLSLRLAKWPDSSVALAEYKACMLAALRSMLPRNWTNAHEEAWVWMWDTAAALLEENRGKAAVQAPALQALYDSLDDLSKFRLRKAIYASFFGLAPGGQSFFKQSNTRLHFIVNKICEMTLQMFAAPAEMVSEISALGLRHVGMGIPPDLFAPFVSAAVQQVQLANPDKVALEAFIFALNLISKILVRTIREGSTVVMKAINANSVQMLTHALETAPRSQRSLWVLHVQVGDQYISPLLWSIESGSFKSAEIILLDLLSIRADRAKYYYGADELFFRHPDIVKVLCDQAPVLIKVLMNGLVWRSQRTSLDGATRRVNYYFKHLLVNQQGTFSDNVAIVAATRDPNLASLEIISVVVNILWNGLVMRAFTISRSWNVICVLVFLLNQDFLPNAVKQSPVNASLYWKAILALRLFTYVLSMGRLAAIEAYRWGGWMRKAGRKLFIEMDLDGNGYIDCNELCFAIKRFFRVMCRKIVYVWKTLKGDEVEVEEEAMVARNDDSDSSDKIDKLTYAIIFLLLIMCCLEPLFWCRKAADWPIDTCPDYPVLYRYVYSIFSMFSVIAYWLLLLDLAVFSTDLSTFLLVCRQCGGELKEFFIVMFYLQFMFAAAMAIICDFCSSDGGILSNILDGVYSEAAITVSFYAGDFRDIEAEKDGLLQVYIVAFTSASQILLLNLLIAQINGAYVMIYKDMVGFSKLNRATAITNAMNAASPVKFAKLVQSLQLEEKLEFDEGDLGLPGGAQYLEPAGLNRQSVERIKRFGGTTNPEMPWPEDHTKHKGDDMQHDEHLMEMEKMIRVALRKMGKMRKKMKSSGGGASGSMAAGGSSLGASQDGSGGSVMSEE